MEKPDKVILLRTTGTEVALSADAAKLPKRIKILNWGDNPNCHGKRVNVGPLFAKCLAAATYPYRKVALDFEHNTFPGTPAYNESSEPRPVAGFGTVEVVEGKGVYLTMSAWTPEGERNAVNFADVSAGAVTDKDGNVVAVASVALCRAGAVDGMDFVEAPLSGGVSSALSGIINSKVEKLNVEKLKGSNNLSTVQPFNSSTSKKGQAMDFKALLIKSLGLGDDATDEAIQAALAKALEKKPGEEVPGAEVPGAEKKNQAPSTDHQALNAAVKAAVEEAVKPIQEQVAALSASAVAHEKQDLIAAAAREGKVIALSADALAKISVEDLQATIAKTAVTVPLNAQTPGKVKEPTAGGEPTEEQRMIALNCGVSPDIFKK